MQRILAIFLPCSSKFARSLEKSRSWHRSSVSWMRLMAVVKKPKANQQRQSRRLVARVSLPMEPMPLRLHIHLLRLSRLLVQQQNLHCVVRLELYAIQVSLRFSLTCPLSALILGGDYYTSTILSSALTKLVLRFAKLASDKKTSNSLRAEVGYSRLLCCYSPNPSVLGNAYYDVHYPSRAIQICDAPYR
jgi:hypothetical protein